ncbi:M56 family metallopeptidase [Thalassobius sp. I31.1]|uniref:M56 family metallopeptidase n=1 Tax=Thalassobius sp. I31.1 TaxID=2109912 RepID=UPI000D1AE9F0|nr:M56 family metallopeptidase [Thalassobius sp. I31.1]
MIRPEALMNLLIDANLALMIAALAFALIEGCMRLAGYGRAYSARLRLVMAAVYVVALSPLVLFFFRTYGGSEIPGFSDVMISQFLKGNISIHPILFDDLLSARSSAVAMVAEGRAPLLILLAFLLIGAALARLIYVAMNLFQVMSLVRGAITLRQIGRIQVMVSDRVHVPFSTRGLRRFYVVLPQDILMDAPLMKVAIGHELQHIRQRDLECEILAAVLSPLFVLNPAFWYLSQKLRALREFACDFEYMRRSGCARVDYARNLVKVAEAAFLQAPQRTMFAFSVPFVGRSRLFSRTARSGLKTRVNVLVAGEVGKPGQMLNMGLMVVLTGMILTGTAMLQKSTGWSHDRIMMSTVVNLERLNSRNNP